MGFLKLRSAFRVVQNEACDRERRGARDKEFFNFQFIFWVNVHVGTPMLRSKGPYGGWGLKNVREIVSPAWQSYGMIFKNIGKMTRTNVRTASLTGMQIVTS